MVKRQGQFDERGGADNLIYAESESEQEIPLRATGGGSLHVTDLEQTFQAMLKELRYISFQLALVTGVSMRDIELESQ